MLKIVHIITRFVNGGADENTMLTCNAQAAKGHDVWLVYGLEHKDRMLAKLDPRVKAMEISSLIRSVSPRHDMGCLIGLIRLFRSIKPDVIHTHTSKAGVIGRMASIVVPSAIVVHGVHILPFSAVPAVTRHIYVLLEKLVAPLTDAYVSVSEGMKEECLAYRLGRTDQHWVIPSGMDLDQFRRAVPACDMRGAIDGQGDNPETLRIVYVAVLERRKRHWELIEAIAPLMAKHENLQLVFAGDGPERARLAALVEELGLSTRIRFLGFRDDVGSVLAGSQIGVFVSEREGLPRSLVQYVLAGLPVVVTDLPGVARVVVDGENGFVVKSDAFDDLVQRLEMLVATPDLRARMSQNSRHMDLSDWDAARMTEAIEAVYAQLLTDAPPADGLRGRGVSAAAGAGNA